MSLDFIEFVSTESVVIKSEDTQDDNVSLKDNLSSSNDGSNVKCGEIFTTNNSDFTLVCGQCANAYDNIPDFGEHLRKDHNNTQEKFYYEIWENDTKASVESFDEANESQYNDLVDDDTDEDDQPLKKSGEVECKFCNRCFTSHVFLKRHKCSPAANQKIFALDEKSTRNRCNLRVTNKRSDSNIYCKLCNRLYRTEYYFMRHKCQIKDEPTENATTESGVDVEMRDPEETDKVNNPDEPDEVTSSSEQPTRDSKDKSKEKKINPDLYCEICNRQFKYKNIFKKHGMQHEVAPLALQKDPDYLKCCYCGVKVSNNAEWYKHENSHTESTPFMCAYCPKRFKGRLEVEMHTNSHTGARPYKCDQCDASFAHSNNLSTHIKRVHLRLTPFSCTLCDKKFLRNVELRIHMRQHTGEKPYQCEECGRSFMIAVQLNEHRKRHTNIRDVKCPVCPMAFFTKKMLRKHMVKHSDERPHICAICGRTFSRKKALDVHNKIHQDVKEYVCSLCGKAFAQPAGLYSHKKSHKIATESQQQFVE